nr:hypothetical protein BdHM001_35510 [Bdellovibrio sp. HM001]
MFLQVSDCVVMVEVSDGKFYGKILGPDLNFPKPAGDTIAEMAESAKTILDGIRAGLAEAEQKKRVRKAS